MKDQTNHEREVNKIYSRRANNYKVTHSFQTLWYDNRWRKIIADMVMKYDFEKVIEIGAGTGLTSKFLIDSGYKGVISGVDINEKMLENTDKRLLLSGRYFPVQANAMYLPFEENSFDACMTMVGLGGIFDPLKAFAEICRVVKNGGKILSIEMCIPKTAILKIIHKKYIEKWIGQKWGFRDIPIEEIILSLGITDYELKFRNDFIFGSVYQLEATVGK